MSIGGEVQSSLVCRGSVVLMNLFQDDQELALRAGHEGIVLLKNEKNTLPLRKDLKSIAVIGPDAENLMNLLGDYSPKKITQHVVSILEGIKAAAGLRAKVVWAKGCGVLGSDKSGEPRAGAPRQYGVNMVPKYATPGCQIVCTWSHTLVLRCSVVPASLIFCLFFAALRTSPVLTFASMLDGSPNRASAG